MSIMSVVPIFGKADSTAATGIADGPETIAPDAAAAALAFDAELSDLPDDPLAVAPDAIDADDESAEILVTSEDPLEAILQAWSGISAEVADKPASTPEAILAQDIIADVPQPMADLPADITAPAAVPVPPRVAGPMGDQSADMAVTEEPADSVETGQPVNADQAAAPDETPVEKPAPILPRQPVAQLADMTPVRVDIDGPSAGRAPESSPATPDTQASRPMPAPAHVIRQISDAFVATTSDQIDIALSPEELGRIHMTISGREGGQHIVIWAERPEVLDQLRRNASTLMQEFTEAGMEDMSFEFRDDRPDHHDGDWRPAQIVEDALAAPITPTAPQPQAYTTLANGPRIDIRI